MPDLQAPNDPQADADAARTQLLFESSRTFLLRSPETGVKSLRVVVISLLLLLFFIIIPLLTLAGKIPNSQVNLLGKYLCFAIVALGIDLVWGYTGLLSLCQALFFALGGYAIGMHLSLPEGGNKYDYPQFMTFAYYGHGTELPWFWAPFRHFWFALFAGIAVPGLFAAVFGFVVLRNRVRGVYFSIITQALAYAANLLMFRNEMLLGGNNGLTNFYPPLTSARNWIIGLYLLTLTTLVVVYFICRAIVKSRLGRVLIAVRDKETRLYFAGYKPHAYKVFAFSVGAMIAGVGGMLYAPQVGIINPYNMDVYASIILVVMAALGGRGRLWGVIFGAIFFNVVQSSLTSDIPNAWILALGLMAVGIVLVFPDGIAGIWVALERELSDYQRQGGRFRQTAWHLYQAGCATLSRLREVAVRGYRELTSLPSRLWQAIAWTLFACMHLTWEAFEAVIIFIAAVIIIIIVSRRQPDAPSRDKEGRRWMEETDWHLCRACVGMLSLITVSVFLIVEALGLTPAALLKDASRPDAVPLKYYVLVLSLVLLGLLYWGIQRQSMRVEKPAEAQSAPDAEPLAAAASKGGA